MGNLFKIILVAAFFIGCGDKEATSAVDTAKEAATTAVKEVKESAKEAATDVVETAKATMTKGEEVTAGVAQDVQVFTADNADGKITPTTIEAAFEKAGFYITGNNNMNKPYVLRFKETGFDVYNLFTSHKPDIVLEIAKEYPQIALFTPLSMSIYTKKGESTISVSTITTKSIAKITEIPEDNPGLIKLGAAIEEALKLAMPNGKFEKLSYGITKPIGVLVTKFEYNMEDEDIETAKEDLQAEIEGELESTGFSVAGFNSLAEDFAEKGHDKYDFFDVYSICKIPVIYEVSKTRPDAGAYAPCSFYMYKVKGDPKVYMAWPSVANWVSSLDIDNKAAVDTLVEAQTYFEDILKEVVSD